jgi:predicted dehydrogenase
VLAPHDTIHAIVRLAPGPNASSNSKPAHGIFEVSFGAPDPSYSKLPNGTTVTGTEGWLSITNTRKDGQPHIRVEVYENGHEVGSASSVPSQVIEEKNQGVDRELENFVRLVRGEGDAGSGTLDGALSDVAFIEAALHSEGKPVTLI